MRSMGLWSSGRSVAGGGAALAESDPFGAHIHALTFQLLSKVDRSAGMTVVVRDFIEISTKRRLSLSSRIEAGLSSSRVTLDALKVVEVADGGRAESATVLSGVYEVEANGDVWIRAKLVRLADFVTEAVAEGTIPQTAWTECGVREVDSVK